MAIDEINQVSYVPEEEADYGESFEFNLPPGTKINPMADPKGYGKEELESWIDMVDAGGMIDIMDSGSPGYDPQFANLMESEMASTRIDDIARLRDQFPYMDHYSDDDFIKFARSGNWLTTDNEGVFGAKRIPVGMEGDEVIWEDNPNYRGMQPNFLQYPADVNMMYTNKYGDYAGDSRAMTLIDEGYLNPEANWLERIGQSIYGNIMSDKASGFDYIPFTDIRISDAISGGAEGVGINQEASQNLGFLGAFLTGGKFKKLLKAGKNLLIGNELLDPITGTGIIGNTVRSFEPDVEEKKEYLDYLGNPIVNPGDYRKANDGKWYPKDHSIFESDEYMEESSSLIDNPLLKYLYNTIIPEETRGQIEERTKGYETKIDSSYFHQE